jgi:hypothetical protein
VVFVVVAALIECGIATLAWNQPTETMANAIAKQARFHIISA